MRYTYTPTYTGGAEGGALRRDRCGAGAASRRVRAGLGGLLVALGILAVGFNPTFDLTSGSTSDASESVVYNKELLKGMPAGATQPSHVLLRSDGALTAEQLTTFRSALTEVPGVGQVGEPRLSQDRAIADFQDAMNRDYLIVFPVAAILIMVVPGLLPRSLVAPWYLMVSVFLGFAATLGAAVLVFQHIQGNSGLIFTLPLIMYLFVVALGTDYNILMAARLREEARAGNDPKQAAALSLRHTGPTVAAAGVMLAGNNVLAQMGFAISVGIGIAAFVMAMFFTPALTALLGHRAWWSGHGDEKPGGAEQSGGVDAPSVRVDAPAGSGPANAGELRQ
ncbi:MMPL family transporter [Nocardia brasiliensis]|uniref:MMPL family transporter n=1 Tax=Nocardia brasiliensis TaxID=37326 RepID=UPI001EECBF46|nr:MMPL family transporter [Nocardia brasiliensis]